MARTVVDIEPIDTWIQLGIVGPSVLTIHQQGSSGRLLFNTTNVDPGAFDNAMIIPMQRQGDQFSSTSPVEIMYARATQLGWKVAVDQ